MKAKILPSKAQLVLKNYATAIKIIIQNLLYMMKTYKYIAFLRTCTKNITQCSIPINSLGFYSQAYIYSYVYTNKYVYILIIKEALNIMLDYEYGHKSII